MTNAGAKRLTFEEFELLPDRPGKRELLRGELIDSPPARIKHHEIAERLFLRSTLLSGATIDLNQILE